MPDPKFEVAVRSFSAGAQYLLVKELFIYLRSLSTTLPCMNIESSIKCSWAPIDPSGALASRSGKTRGN